MNLQDLFTLAVLTDAINALPNVPGKAGATGLFVEKGVPTTTVVIEHHAGRLNLVQSTSRNDDPAPVKDGKRVRRTFEIPHLPQNGQLLPSELQGLAAFGSENAPPPQATVINDKLEAMKANLEATREWQRIGAIKGTILDADGSVIYDLYKEFGISEKKLTVALSNAGTDVRAKLLEAKRWIEKKTPGVVITGFKAFCGPGFFDALTGHDKVQAAFAGWQAAQDRLGGDMRNGFTFGDITFEEYNAQVSGKDFVGDAVARIYPVGRNVFGMYNAPANYNETVNTIGRPFYAKAEERRLGKGWDLEAQSNPLAMCFYPEALVELTAN